MRRTEPSPPPPGEWRISVVIPALNEADNLSHVLHAIPAWVYEVVVVDGGSTDGTLDVARATWAEREGVAQGCHLDCPVLHLMVQRGRGKGDALRTGVLSALGDIIVHLDADGSTAPEEIGRFVGALVDGADFAKGSRFLPGGGSGDMTPHRRLGNWGLVLLSNVLFGTRFTDITYGYNAFWRRHAHVLALEIDGWAQEIISNIRSARHGLRVVEVPSFEYPRRAGEAKLRCLPAGWTILLAMLRERGRGTVAGPIGNDPAWAVAMPDLAVDAWRPSPPPAAVAGRIGERVV